MSKTKQLQQTLGGIWKYQRNCWVDITSKEDRHVSRVCMCSCDDECYHLPGYFLYNDGHPKRVVFGINRITLI
jgi:hypothetical protein